jgi:RNA polymerase sigma-70 factor (ECF subfamily)
VIERARHGDGTEFARIYAPLAYAMARKCGLGQGDAEDVMQETMVQVWKQLPEFEYDRGGSFRGWLKTIVRRRVLDAKQKRRPTTDDEFLQTLSDRADPFEEQFDRELRKAHLMAALDRIRNEVKPTTFQSFQLAELCGWSIARVARTLGLTANQVSQNKHRVRERLLAHFQELQCESA